MLRYFVGSVHRTLTIILLLATVPALCIILFSGVQQRRAIIQGSNLRAENITNTLSNQQEQIFNHVRNHFFLLSQASPVRDLDLNASQALLHQLTNESKIYNNLLLYDTRGNLLVSGVEGEATPDVVDVPFFVNALRYRDFVISGVDVISRYGGDANFPVLYVAYPVLAKDGQIVAVLVGAIQIPALQRFIGDGIRLSEGAYIELIDSQGKLISSYPYNPEMMPADNVPPSMWWSLNPNKDKGQTVDPQTQRGEADDIIMTFSNLNLDAVPGFDIHLLFSLPQAPIYADANALLYHTLYRFIIAFLLTLILAPGISFFLLRRPTYRLISAVNSLKNGDFDNLTSIKDPIIEFKNIAVAFNNISKTLKERTTELNEATEQSESAIKAKSEFLANISHEMRTPMNAIIGLAHLCMKSPLTTKQLDYLQRIHSAGHQLLKVINDILDFSKIEAGKMDLEQIPFDLNLLINGIINTHEERAKQKKLNFTFYVDKNIPRSIIGDPLRLAQILNNLLENAIKFTNSGFVRLDISSAGIFQHQVTLVFEITDSGIGIGKEQSNKLFTAFSQADTSSTRVFGGSGLGLAICKRLLTLMKGNITIHSQAGKGTKILCSATFKLTKQNVAALKPSHHLDIKTLIIDDDDLSRKSMKTILSSLNYTAYGVADTSEGLTELKNADKKNMPYDLVLINWRMPDSDSLETTKNIKKNLGLNKIPTVIFLTTYNKKEITDKAKTFGVDGFLHKPLDGSIINDTLSSLIKQNKLIDQTNSNAEELEEIPKDLKRIVPAKTTPTSQNNNLILLVEDNLINQEIAVDILESANYKVLIANNGQEALDILNDIYSKNNKVSVVLMDLQMPVLGGIEATRKIRADKRFELLPVIAMTASTDDSEKRKCQEVDMDGYIGKPFDVEQLFETLNIWRNGREIINPQETELKTIILQIIQLLKNDDSEGAVLFKQNLSKLNKEYPNDILQNILKNINNINYDSVIVMLEELINSH
ncbi:hybrid sensor histidine kinase/response regulator [Desulfovibrio litoralis]|uniref:histidine kinase n=1 Tax=Desulfovibrio litoralis DSM 11393 TaxID=1121455 RepID=A0A1M7RWZ6_9BACT|nr:hybrid sensor histidine kinase/response regulator [Desulfovibrio litoralis]SHN50654.1 Signal transduction histidine kinase [Desulfovibrio litoralis DSM 11393]